MSFDEIVSRFGAYPKIMLAYYAVILAITLIATLYVNRANFKIFSYVFSAIIYLVSIPALLSVVLIVKGDFASNVTTYSIPLIALIIIFMILKQGVGLKNIPAYKNLTGVLFMAIGAFAITYLLQKMVIGVFFITGIQSLVILFFVIFILIKIGWHRFFGK